MPNFDILARPYCALELLAFGRDLERARWRYLQHLAERKNILMLGEGDGRTLQRTLAIAPEARVSCVDSSLSMLDLAASRLRPEDRTRVTFICADVRELNFVAAQHDAVTTLFFLDCFTEPEVTTLIRRLSQALTPNAVWLFADFALPRSGIRRWRAQAWLAVLYAFFRATTGLQTRRLPAAERILRDASWCDLETAEFQHGMLRSVRLARTSR